MTYHMGGFFDSCLQSPFLFPPSPSPNPDNFSRFTNPPASPFLTARFPLYQWCTAIRFFQTSRVFPFSPATRTSSLPQNPLGPDNATPSPNLLPVRNVFLPNKQFLVVPSVPLFLIAATVVPRLPLFFFSPPSVLCFFFHFTYMPPSGSPRAYFGLAEILGGLLLFSVIVSFLSCRYSIMDCFCRTRSLLNAQSDSQVCDHSPSCAKFLL